VIINLAKNIEKKPNANVLFSIVIQGELSKFSIDTIKYYILIRKRQEVRIPIVLSTWKSKHVDDLLSLLKVDTPELTVILNMKPTSLIARNLELQTISTYEGMQLLNSDTDINDESFAFKVRSDQRIDLTKLINSYKKFINLNKKIWALDLFTRARIPFHLGDMVIGMSLKEHLIYWAPNSLVHEYEYQQWLNGSPFHLTRLFRIEEVKCLPEVCLLTNYLHKSQLSPIDGLGDWYVFLENHVYIESAETISLYSDKYKEKLNQRTFMPSRYFSPIHFFVSSYIIKCVSKGEKLGQVTNVKQLLLINWLTYPQTLIFGSIRFFYQLLSKSLISFIKK